MKKIAVVSALVISLSLMNARAEGCPAAGRCAVAHHRVKHTNKEHPAQSMRGALTGAYQR